MPGFFRGGESRRQEGFGTRNEPILDQPLKLEQVTPEYRESVAQLLRRTREYYEQGLRDVAVGLRIRHVHLQAIEEGRYDDLPGPTYAIGFIRTYAEYLGLDSEEVVRRFKEEAENFDRQTELVFPSPAPEGKLPGGAIIMISTLLAAVAYGGWFYLSNQERFSAELIPPVPDRLAEIVEGEETMASLALDSSAALLPPPVSPEGETGAAELSRSLDDTPIEPSVAPSASADTDTLEVVTAADEEIASVPIEDARQQVTVLDAGEEASPRFVPDALDTDLVPDTGAPSVTPETISVTDLPPVVTQHSPSSAAAATPTVTIVPSQAETQPTSSAEAGMGEAEEAGLGEAEEAGLSEAENEPSLVIEAETAPAAGASSTIPEPPVSTQIAMAQGSTSSRTYGADNLDVRVVLHAKLDSWVQVRDQEDVLLLTRVLRPGDSYRVPNQAGLTLLTGNAGGVEIEVDGRKLGTFGGVGVVRRNIALDPERLLSGEYSTE